MKAIGLLVVLALLPVSPAWGYSMPKKVPDGWLAVVELGALVTTGNTRTRSVNGALKFSVKEGKWENQLNARFLNSSSSILKDRKDDEGNLILRPDGKPLQEEVKGKSTNRIFIGYQPRWYWRGRHYLFGILDWETNKPADLKQSNRQIFGIGHKFWRDKKNYFSAEIGAGNKRRELVSGMDSRSGIGYVGFAFVRQLTERVQFSAELDSDFGSDNKFTEVEFVLGYRITERASFKLKYASRQNTAIDKVDNPLDSTVDSETTISLQFNIL